MKILALILCCVTASCKAIQPSDLDAFQSDACSLSFEGTWSEPNLWCHCCVQHDLAYWQGGTALERLSADQKMAECVKKIGATNISKVMYAAVRMGGSPYFPMWYRWGYGWSYGRAYQALSSAEKERIAVLASEEKVTQQQKRMCE